MFHWMNVMDFIIWDIWFSHEYDRRINSKGNRNGRTREEKRIELEQDMSWKMYQILTITACTANLIGTICNFCIHGTKLPTILCGICLLMIVTIGIIGWTTKKVQIPAVLIILILVWFEFPYLYYCYGDASIVYLVLGVVGLAIFFPRNVVIVSLRSRCWNIW